MNINIIIINLYELLSKHCLYTFLFTFKCHSNNYR